MLELSEVPTDYSPLADLVLADMAADLSTGKRSLARVFASLVIEVSRSGFEAADQSG
jgi:hypothetical protein